MPSVDAKLNFGPMHVNSNVIMAIDIRRGHHKVSEGDLLEICILPLNHSYKPHKEFPVFNIRMRPSQLVDLKAAGISRDVFKEQYEDATLDGIKGTEMFEHWIDKIGLRTGKKIMPLAWNWIEVRPWIEWWLGELTYDHFFSHSVRDLLHILNFINDRDDYHGEEPKFRYPEFDRLINKCNVKLFDRNSLPANCTAMSEAYRHLLHLR